VEMQILIKGAGLFRRNPPPIPKQNNKIPLNIL
jgi:hypothetical protein